MRNKGYLNSHWRLRMYHRDALEPSDLKHIKWMWNKLAKEELEMTVGDKLIEAVCKEVTEKTKDPAFLKDKFDEYFKLVEFFFVLEHDYRPMGFMAVKGEMVLSLWVIPVHRGFGKGRFLIANHREIFNKPLEVQCYRNNAKGIRFYESAGFNVIDATGLYTRLRLD